MNKLLTLSNITYLYHEQDREPRAHRELQYTGTKGQDSATGRSL